MPRVQTHFEQVPVAIVKKIAKLEIPDTGETLKPRKKRKPKGEAIVSDKHGPARKREKP